MATNPLLGCLELDRLAFFDSSTATLAANEIVTLSPNVDTVDSYVGGEIDFASNLTGNTGTLVLLRNIRDPFADQDAATKKYVDDIAVAGVSWKNSARYASDANVDLADATASAGLGDVVGLDGTTTVVAGDRILLKNQSTASENGIYVANADGLLTSWVRADDAATGVQASGAAVFVEEGDVHADTAWVVTTDGANFNDAITWTQFSSAPSPAGSDTQIQYNDGGILGADANFVWDKTGQTLTVISTATDTDAFIVTTGDISLTEGNVFLDDASGLININSSALIMDTDSISHNQAANFTLEKAGAGDFLIQNTDTTAGSDILLKLGTQNLSADNSTAFRFQNSNDEDMVVFDNTASYTFNIDGDTTDASQGAFTINITDDALVNPVDIFKVDGLTATTGLVTFGEGGDVILEDNVELRIGTSSDTIIVSDGAGTSVTSQTGNLLFDNTNATGTTQFQMGDDAGATNISFLNNTGDTLVNVISGGATGTNSTSTTSGTMTITGGLGVSQDVYATAFKASSDATLKENIVPLNDALRTLHKIDGYQYDWIDRKEDTPKQWGVLAQQLEEAGLEHMVSDGKVKAVNYLFLIPLLIESVKELASLTLDEVTEEE